MKKILVLTVLSVILEAIIMCFCIYGFTTIITTKSSDIMTLVYITIAFFVFLNHLIKDAKELRKKNK